MYSYVRKTLKVNIKEFFISITLRQITMFIIRSKVGFSKDLPTPLFIPHLLSSPLLPLLPWPPPLSLILDFPLFSPCFFLHFFFFFPPLSSPFSFLFLFLLVRLSLFFFGCFNIFGIVSCRSY